MSTSYILVSVLIVSGAESINKCILCKDSVCGLPCPDGLLTNSSALVAQEILHCFHTKSTELNFTTEVTTSSQESYVICVQECPDRYYKDGNSSKCLDCDSICSGLKDSVDTCGCDEDNALINADIPLIFFGVVFFLIIASIIWRNRRLCARQANPETQESENVSHHANKSMFESLGKESYTYKSFRSLTEQIQKQEICEQIYQKGRETRVQIETHQKNIPNEDDVIYSESLKELSNTESNRFRSCTNLATSLTNILDSTIDISKIKRKNSSNDIEALHYEETVATLTEREEPKEKHRPCRQIHLEDPKPKVETEIKQKNPSNEIEALQYEETVASLTEREEPKEKHRQCRQIHLEDPKPKVETEIKRKKSSNDIEALHYKETVATLTEREEPKEKHRQCRQIHLEVSEPKVETEIRRKNPSNEIEALHYEATKREGNTLNQDQRSQNIKKNAGNNVENVKPKPNSLSKSLEDLSSIQEQGMIRKEKNNREEPKCDGFRILCLSDMRLQTDNKTNRQIKSEGLSDILQKGAESEYDIILYMMDNAPSDDKILKSCVINEMKLVCRWILSNCTIGNDCLNKCLLRSYQIGNKDIISSLAWHATRQFYKLNKETLDKNAIDIYPAYKCICKDEKQMYNKCLQQSEKLLVVEWQTPCIQFPEEFLHFKVVGFCYDGELSRSNNPKGFESELIHAAIDKQLKSSSVSLSMPEIGGITASKLYKKHRNLSLICPCPFKSTKYPTSQNVEDVPCVQLYCSRKGIIPLWEDHFPKIVKGIPTDVLEGHGCMASLPLRVGDRVGTDRSDGTLGGFYLYFDHFDCFLTCAHVLYGLSILLAPANDLSRNKGVNVLVKTYSHQGGPPECGKVLRRIFKHGNPNATSIDVALVHINEQFKIDPNDIFSEQGLPQHFSRLGLTSPYINQNYVEYQCLTSTGWTAEVEAPGAVTRSPTSSGYHARFDYPTAKDVHFENLGQMTGTFNGNVFQPLLFASPAHVQLPVGGLTDRRIITLYNQMVLNLPLQQGDSGTCVYVTGHAPKNTGCIGIANSFCSGSGLSIVTPIQEIISEINS